MHQPPISGEGESPEKTEKMDEVSTFPRNKGSDGTHGTKFEYDTTLLAYLKCVVEHEEWKVTNNSGVKSFFVANNVQGVGAFDDVVVRKEIVRNGETKTKLTFTQCKHIAGKESNPKKGGNYITRKEIQKYFDSFIKVYKILLDEQNSQMSDVSQEMTTEEHEIQSKLKRLFSCQFSDCEFSFVSNIESFPKDLFENVTKSETVKFDSNSDSKIQEEKEYRLLSEKCFDVLECKEIAEKRNELIFQFCNMFRILSIPDHQTNLEIETALQKLCVGEIMCNKIHQNRLRETLLDETKSTFEESIFFNEKTDAHNNIKNFLYLKKLSKRKIAKKYKQIMPLSIEDATGIVSKYQTNNETEHKRLAILRIYRSFHYMNQTHLCIIVDNKVDYVKWQSARSTLKYRNETKIYIFFENYVLTPMVELSNEQFINIRHKTGKQHDSTLYKQLYKDEEKFLENAKILFQGYEIELKELCSNLSEVLDEAAVCDILESKQLVIGHELPKQPNIYIIRKFRIKVLTGDIRKIIASFVRSGKMELGGKFLLLSRKEKNTEQRFEKCDDKTKDSCIYVENIDKARKYLRELMKNDISNHYLCRHSNENFELRFMTGMENKNFDYEIVDEKFLIDGSNSERITILSDVAGMGKSTSMQKLAVEYKILNRSSWVHYIQLGKHSVDLENAKASPSNAINFVALKILKLEGIDLKLFTDTCNKTGNVALFLDGLDELPLRAREVFPELLLALEKTKVTKIFVSSRQNMVRDLEKLTLQNTIDFLEFSFEDKVNCLLEIWKQKLAETGDNIDNEELKKYAEKIIKNTELERNSIKEILAIPLQIKMFAVALYEEMLEYFKHNAVFNFEFDISNLYKNFIHFHVIHYHAKSITDWNVWHQEKRETYIEDKLNGVPEFVCSLIIPNLVESKLNDMKVKIAILRDDLGLITDDSQTPPLFLHKTIAEYLAAEFIVKQFLAQENGTNGKRTIESVLTEDGYNILRKFIDSILEENRFPAYFEKSNPQIAISNDLNRKDTAFHVAASEGNCKLMKALLQRDESSINHKNKRGKTALHLACSEHRTEVVKFLLCHDCSVNIYDDEGYNAFHVAACEGRTQVMDLLLTHEPSLLNKLGYKGTTPLHIACLNQNSEAAKFLLSHNCSLSERDDYGATAFHIASMFGNTEIMDLLIKH